MLNVTTSLGGLEQLAARLKSFDKNELQTIIANTITNEIQKATGSGYDVYGKKFAPYTEAYAKYGRRNKGLSVDPVDLRVSGDLLNSLIVEKKGVLSTITVADDQKDKAEGLMKKRKFLGVSKTTRESIIVFVREYVGKLIKG